MHKQHVKPIFLNGRAIKKKNSESVLKEFAAHTVTPTDDGTPGWPQY